MNKNDCPDKSPYYYTLICPGKKGPPGPSASIDSILVARDRIETVNSGNLLTLGSIINSTGNSFELSNANTITILKSGTYLINFSTIIYNTNTPGDLGVSLQINNNIIPTASEYIATQTGSFSSELQHNFNASIGDTITLINNSSVANSYHDPTLSIIKLA